MTYPPQPPQWQQPPRKSNTGRIVLIVLVVVIGLPVLACGALCAIGALGWNDFQQ